MKTDKTTRPVGLTKDVGWEVGARRTFPIQLEAAWRLITTPEGLNTWLGSPKGDLGSKGDQYTLPDGTTGAIRVFKPNSHLRLTWYPPGWPRASTIQVRVVPSGEKTVIAFHQEHLPGPEEREERRVFFKNALDQLEEMIVAKNL